MNIEINQLNIKGEIKLVTIFWITCSLFYFLIYLFVKDPRSDTLRAYLVLLSILARNLGAFYAQTVKNIYLATHHDETYAAERINTKLTIINFEVTMTHSLPLGYFQQFVMEQRYE